MIQINTTNQDSAIAAWNYNDSVTKVKDLYTGPWLKKSSELLEELYQAKLQLNKGPGNPKNRYTWKQYCQEAFNGSPTQRTVDTWLARHEIGEEAWKAAAASRPQSVPAPIDLNSIFIVKHKSNNTGSYTFRFSVPQYPDCIFEETITV